MAEQVRVVVDAMGGDNAPAEPVKAAVEAVTERQDIKVILTGKQEVIDKELAKYSGYPKNQIRVVNASGRLVPGWTEQKQLLLEEGISFKQNGCVDLKKHLWNYSVSE